MTLKKYNIGDIVGHWRVIESSYPAWYTCRCCCGVTRNVRRFDLDNNKTKSCGCLMTHNLKKTMMSKYKVDNPQKLPEFKEKTKNTNLEKYGYTCTAKNKDIKEKQEKTCLERYGHKSPFGSKEVQCRGLKTLKDKYNVDHPSHLSDHFDKCKKTSQKNWGTDHPRQNELIKKKTEKTCLEKYGSKSPMGSTMVALKVAKASNSCFIKCHWYTEVEVVCVGSYEAKTVDYLNSLKINYVWQPKVFVMPNGRTYRPDLYLCDEDKYIEIKGYFRSDAKEKWNWFASQYPNAELWDYKTLKSKGIL